MINYLVTLLAISYHITTKIICNLYTYGQYDLLESKKKVTPQLR